MALQATLMVQEAAVAQPVGAPVFNVQASRNGEKQEDDKDKKEKESTRRVAKEWEKREVGDMKAEKVEEVCTMVNMMDNTKHQFLRSFNWAEEVFPVTFVALTTHALQWYALNLSMQENLTNFAFY